MEENHTKNPQKILLAISNFNIFGMGYLLTGLKMRWLISIIFNIGLIIIAQFSDASKNPVLWAFIFLLVFSGMAVDLWFQLRKKPELITDKLTSQQLLLPLVAIFTNLVFFGAFFAYRWAGNNLILSGENAYVANDFEGSFKDYYSVSRLYTLSLNPAVISVKDRLNEVSTILAGRDFLVKKDFPSAIESVAKFNELFPSSTKKKDMINLGIDTYLAWSTDLQSKNEFGGSLQKLQLVENDYLKDIPERSNEIENAIAQNYLIWGQQLIETKDYDQAIEKFEIVTTKYPKTDSFDKAFSAAAQAHYSIAMQLMDANSYELAVEHLQTILDVYRTSPEKVNASESMPKALIGWGKSLDAQSSFLLAMEKFNDVKQYTSDKAILAEADVETQKTIELLANDSGADGSSVLTEAQSEACSGTIPTNPSVGILKNEPGKAAVCGEILIPWELIADTPGSFRYAIFREDSTKRIQACPYTRGHTLERWVNTSLITIKLISNGDIFSKNSFTGTPPSNCPSTYSFSGTVDQSWGDAVNMDDISAWVGKVLK